MFISLANGGTLVTVPQSARKDATQLANIMLVESITYTAFAESENLDLLKHGSKTLRKCASWRLAFDRRLESDREVTIQDHRVNLDEIAEVIIREASPAIFDAAVSRREESGMLAAFVTLADESVDNIDVFLRRLKAALPPPTYDPWRHTSRQKYPKNSQRKEGFQCNRQACSSRRFPGQSDHRVFFTDGDEGEDYLEEHNLRGSNGRSEARVGLLLRGRQLPASHSSTSCVAV